MISSLAIDLLDPKMLTFGGLGVEGWQNQGLTHYFEFIF